MSEEKMEWREIWKELIDTSKKAVLAPNKSGLVYFDALPFQDDKMLLFEKAISYELLGMKNEAIEFYTKAADIKEGLPVEHWRKRANYFLTRIKTQGICQTHEINLSSDLYTIQWNVFFNEHSFVFLDDYIRYLAISSISRICTEPAMAVIIFRTCLEFGLWIHYEEVVKKLDETYKNNTKKNKTVSLDYLLVKLDKNGKISKNQYCAYDKIRYFGNEAAHPKIMGDCRPFESEGEDLRESSTCEEVRNCRPFKYEDEDLKHILFYFNQVLFYLNDLASKKRKGE